MADPFDLYDFVKREEGYNPRAYWDHKQWSIGHGTRAIGPNEFIDRSEADRRLRTEVDKAGGYVDQAFPGLDPQRRGALASFTYNLGPGWIGSSRLAAAVKSGDWASASRIMQEYNRASGQPNAGLLARRKREADLFLSGGPSAPQPPDGMDAATYGASPPPSPRMALGGPKPMPIDPQTGEWVPEQEIARRRALANQMWDVPTAPGWAGGLAKLLGGGVHGYQNAKMNQAIAGNQRFSDAATERALQASDLTGVYQALASGSPEQKKSALSLMLQEKDPARKFDLEMKERALAQARQTDPLALEKMQGEIAAAKAKRERDEAFMRSLQEATGQSSQGGAPVPPQSSLAPVPPVGQTPVPGITVTPSIQRSSGAGEGVMPGGVTPAQFAPQQPQQQPQQRPAAPDQDIVNTPWGRMSREKARKLGGQAIMTGEPRYLEMGKVLLEAAGPSNAGAAFGKEGGNLLDKKSIDATNHIARLVDVEKSFNPEFLQIPKRLGFAWTSVRAKFQDLKPEQAKPLAEFAEFRRASVENMSRLLNELSGAAVSPQEYERIRNTQPDAGTGIFDGDDPVTFHAKMRGVVAQQKRAIARYNYLRKNGPQGANPWDVMPLEDIDKVINAKGAELHKQIKQENPKADPAVIDQAVKAKLAQEFGIQI
jgi:lysozyme